MKTFALLALILALIGLTCPAWGISCEKSVEQYLDSGESYTYANVSVAPGETYLLFSINGSYAMLGKCDAGPKLVSDYGTIESVLGAYAKSTQTLQSVAPGGDWQTRMNGLLGKFSGSRGKEAECKRYIGIDRTPCNDRQSCVKSCYTPMCNELKQSNECKRDSKECDFIDSIVFFSNNLTVLDNGASEIGTLLANIGKIRDPEELDSGISACERMLASADSINQNSLMQENKYYFCPRVGYDKESLSSLRAELVALRNKYALLVLPGVTAKAVSFETKRRLELFDNLERCAENVDYSKKAISKIAGSANPASNYSEVNAPLGKMNALAGELESLCINRKFSEAAGAMNKFAAEEGTANAALKNVSEEYSSTVQLYGEVLAKVQALPQDVNASKLAESMDMIKRELPLVNNASDLIVLRGVLLQNQKEIDALSKPAPGLFEQLGLPLAIAMAITALLYILMKKTKRKGL